MLRRGTALVTGTAMAAVLLAGCATAVSPSAPLTTPSASSTAASPTTTEAVVTPTRQPHILVFTATGDAAVDSVTYVVDGHSTTDTSVRLPWRVSLDLPADGAMHNYSATIKTRAGDVHILCILDGKVQTRSDGGGTGTGTAQLSGGFAG